MGAELSFEETWDKMDPEPITMEDLQIKEELQRLKPDQKILLKKFSVKPGAKVIKPHRKYPSNYTPPKRRLRKKK